MNEKELNEIRNAKIEEMESIINLARTETRPVTEEETEKFENLEKEIASIDNTIAMCERVEKMELRKVEETTVETSVENKEVKMFENRVRGIVNADTTVADGQATIPTTIAQRIIDRVVEISPLYARAERFNVNGKLVLPKYDKENSSIVMSYVTEGTSGEAGKVKVASIELEGHLGRCLAKVSNTLINNSAFDIVAFVIEKMAQAIATFIDGELLNGTEGKAEGLSGIGADMTVTASGELTADNLIDVQEKVVDDYQAEAVWIMSRATRTAIRKLKDADKNYLLNRDLNAKWGYTLLGKDVYCSDKAGNNVFYGDLSGLAVKVSEDINMKVLSEKYADEHMTGIVAFVEFDAKVQDTQKLAKLVIA